MPEARSHGQRSGWIVARADNGSQEGIKLKAIMKNALSEKVRTAGAAFTVHDDYQGMDIGECMPGFSFGRYVAKDM
jgi:hypothetical protein